MDLLAYDVDSTALSTKEASYYQTKLTSTTPCIKGNNHEISVHRSGELRKCHCKIRYRIRWFSSKAAFLVLFWNFLLSYSTASLNNLYPSFGVNTVQSDLYRNLVTLVPYVSWTVVAPVSGWLADTYMGSYRVARIGMLLLFLSTVINCVLYQVTDKVLEFDSRLFVSILIISNAIGYAGQAAVLVTLLSLGLNQMPDASTENITSFIAWFLCSIQAGYWLCDSTSYIPVSCINPSTDYLRVWGFFPALSVGIVCLSDILLSPKWLIVEPKSPQSLLIIFHVLKFAKQHKAPLNRSSLTYWEEDIPSGIDLGKSKYGGPYSTEEVEDVKTILRLLAISVPLLFIMVAFYLCQDSSIIPETKSCVGAFITYIIDNDSNTYVLGTIIYEFAIYPFISSMFESSILKRIGLASFLVTLLNVIYLGLYIAQSVNSELTWPWLSYPQAAVAGFLKVLWMTSMLELLYAQSPYKMRGVVLGYFWFLNLLSYMLVGTAIILIGGGHSNVVYSGTSTGVSVVGLGLYCVLAWRYKRRERDDIPTPHKWAEDAYDRYLGVST